MLDATKPGVLADSYCGLPEAQQLFAHGYRWISTQAQNDANLIDWDLGPAKQAGLLAGVWGVSYELENFYRDGLALGRQAVKLHAQHCMADLESCFKNTRGTGWARDHYIKGVRDGGWTGPVHLTTLGAPDSPLVNDYAFDLGAFLETGGSIITQDYYNMHYGYAPALSKQYYVDRLMVPMSRWNSLVSLAYSENHAPRPNVRISGSEWVPLLKEAKVHKNLSIYLLRSILPGDLEGLDALTLATAPIPEPTPPTPTPKPLVWYRDEALKILQEGKRVYAEQWAQTYRVDHMIRVGTTTEDKRKLVDPTLDKIGV